MIKEKYFIVDFWRVIFKCMDNVVNNGFYFFKIGYCFVNKSYFYIYFRVKILI